ncbi:MAG: hypothetical protein A2148_10535 [Chloroflexi bacterium RBG_16_68_14]|nr:MAG: hypothetical protein A2148_10535 [Chloroflexi bacterium RBG_16_68_14]
MSKVWLVGVTVFVVALTVAGLVVALVSTRGGVDLLPADSPEGVVQRFLLALEDKEYREAHGYLSASTKKGCTLEDFARQASYQEVRDYHMTLEDTERLDDTAIVTARVTVFEPNVPFGASEYSYERTFDLTLEEGQWRLAWPDYWCPPLYKYPR